MATLAAQIETEIQVMIADKTLIDLSRQRSSTATLNAARLTKMCEMVAAKVQAFVGVISTYDSANNDHVEACDMGTRLLLLRMRQVYPGTLTPEGAGYIGDVMAELADARTRRQDESTDNVRYHSNDVSDLDARFPATSLDLGDDDREG